MASHAATKGLVRRRAARCATRFQRPDINQVIGPASFRMPSIGCGLPLSIACEGHPRTQAIASLALGRWQYVP